SVGYMGAPPPKVLATVTNGDHCDVDNPADPVCPTVCGGTPWNSATSLIFHRYAIAWTACILAHDTSVAPWVGGSEMQADIDAGLLSGVEDVDVAMVSCTGIGDGGVVTGGDAGHAGDAGVEHDASSSGGGSDASSGGSSSSGGSGGGSGSSGGGDAGSGAAKSGSTGGCACTSTPGAPLGDWWLLGAATACYAFALRRRQTLTSR